MLDPVPFGGTASNFAPVFFHGAAFPKQRVVGFPRASATNSQPLRCADPASKFAPSRASQIVPTAASTHHRASGLDTLASSGSCLARRLPPSTERRAPPGEPALAQISRSSLITGPSSLPRDNPPLSCASVLSASRLEPLAPFPLASPATSSRSVPKSSRGSCRLHAGCRSAGIRASPELIPKVVPTPGFDIA